jgi:hypothetical protein
MLSRSWKGHGFSHATISPSETYVDCEAGSITPVYEFLNGNLFRRNRQIVIS